jgi:Protein of unknown function (DUF1580)
VKPDAMAGDRITLEEVRDLVPPPASGKRTTASTIRVWAITGCSGVRLEAVRIGHRWTSKAAVGRFVAAITAVVVNGVQSEQATAPTRQGRDRREEDIAADLAKLERRGC